MSKRLDSICTNRIKFMSYLNKNIIWKIFKKTIYLSNIFSYRINAFKICTFYIIYIFKNLVYQTKSNFYLTQAFSVGDCTNNNQIKIIKKHKKQLKDNSTHMIAMIIFHFHLFVMVCGVVMILSTPIWFFRLIHSIDCLDNSARHFAHRFL